jgi:hypothetical protein
MGCSSSSAGPFFETTKVLKLPIILDSAGEVDAYDYILSTCMAPSTIMQLAHVTYVTNAFVVQGGVVANRLEMGNPMKPQSDFYETKHRTNHTMQIETFTANGTISDPASVKEQAFCVTTLDITLKRTSQGVETTYSVGQPALSVPGGGMVIRMMKPLLRKRWETEFAATEELYANCKVPLPAPAGEAEHGQATGAAFGSMNYGGANYGS